MSFDVAIYNAGCGDGIKIVDSVKAAYLYADNVRVYDYSIPRSINKLSKAKEKKHKDLLEIAQKANLDNQKDILSIPLDDLESRFTDSLDIAAFFTYRRQLETLEIDMDTLIEYGDLVDKMQDARQSKNKHYSEKEFRKDLNQLGIAWIDPFPCTEDIIRIPTVRKRLFNFDYRFFSDCGFKLFNSYPKYPKTSHTSSSILVPSYLSEYAISKLPGFETASLDEMIDIRKELDAYIVPYRKAIVKMAKEINEIPDSESLQQECATLYINEIEPKVAEINAAVHDNNVFKNILRSAITSELGWTSIGSFFAAVISTGVIAEFLEAFSPIALGGYSIANGIKTTLEKEKDIQKNEMYFLYEAANILETEYS